MIFLTALALAIFVLPSPWGLIAIVVGAILELFETGFVLFWSSRRRASVGVETLVGKRGVAVGALWPEGQVRVGGELWNARCESGCEAGTSVVVRRIDGLTLEVEPA